MRRKLDYSEHKRFESHIRKDLHRVLLLTKHLSGKYVVELLNEALEQYLPCALEICYDQMLNEPNNPNNSPYFQRQVRELLEKFGRL